MTGQQIGFSFNKPAVKDISRGRFNANSKKAWERLKSGEVSMRVRIRDFIVACGPQGVTAAKISECFGCYDADGVWHNRPLHTFSGRISKLKADGEVFDSGRSQNGFTILVGRAEWRNGSCQ